MKRTIEIPDDICDILMDICSKMRIPATLTIEERCEFAIDALANSYDAAMPVRAEQLKEHTELNMEQAINTALNPNIGMEFTRDPKPMEVMDERDQMELNAADPNQ